MANDSQRDKARAVFGKNFFENSKALPDPKNSMTALQARANARPIPTFKVGGVVKKAEGGKAQDFTGLMKKAASKAAAKGNPVMKQGGATNEYTAKRVASRIEAGNFKEGGSAERQKARLDRKTADIEKDYKIALAKGKNEGVAKAKYEQRMADAKDDYAKWTGGDRSKTSAAEKAAEAALSEARKTKGVSIATRDAAAKAKAAAPAVAATAITAAPDKLLSDFDATFAKKSTAAPAKRTTTQVRPKNTPQPSRAERGVTTPGQGRPAAAPAAAARPAVAVAAKPQGTAAPSGFGALVPTGKKSIVKPEMSWSEQRDARNAARTAQMQKAEAALIQGARNKAAAAAAAEKAAADRDVARRKAALAGAVASGKWFDNSGATALKAGFKDGGAPKPAAPKPATPKPAAPKGRTWFDDPDGESIPPKDYSPIKTPKRTYKYGDGMDGMGKATPIKRAAGGAAKVRKGMMKGK